MKNKSEAEAREKRRTEGKGVVALERSREYRQRKEKLQNTWKNRIFERDGWKCRACGESSSLHLAHVTSVRAFLRAGHGLDAMELSYRDDNLVTLCETCHKSQHKEISSAFDENLGQLLEKRRRMRENPVIREYLDLCAEINRRFEKAKQDVQERRRKVERLFYKIKRERGWKSAKTFLELIEKGEKAQDFHINSTKKEREMHRQGVCEWHCATCTGETRLCECGRLLCEYHFPLHIKGERHF